MITKKRILRKYNKTDNQFVKYWQYGLVVKALESGTECPGFESWFDHSVMPLERINFTTYFLPYQSSDSDSVEVLFEDR